MNQSSKTALILAGACTVGLVLYAVGLARAGDRMPIDPPVMDVRIDQIATVRLESAYRESAITVDLVSELAPSIVVDNRRFPANPGRVESLLSTAVELRRFRTVGTTSGETYFPDGGSRLLFFDSQGAVLADVTVGAPTNTGDEVYYRPHGDRGVGVTDGAILFYIEQSPTFYADLRVFGRGPAAEEIAALRLEPSGTGLFPDAVYDDPGPELYSMVRRILDLEGVAFSEFDPNDAGAASTALVELVATNRRIWRLHIYLPMSQGDQVGGFVAVRPEGPGLPSTSAGGGFSYLVPRTQVAFAVSQSL